MNFLEAELDKVLVLIGMILFVGLLLFADLHCPGSDLGKFAQHEADEFVGAFLLVLTGMARKPPAPPAAPTT